MSGKRKIERTVIFFRRHFAKNRRMPSIYAVHLRRPFPPVGTGPTAKKRNAGNTKTVVGSVNHRKKAAQPKLNAAWAVPGDDTSDEGPFTQAQADKSVLLKRTAKERRDIALSAGRCGTV